MSGIARSFVEAVFAAESAVAMALEEPLPEPEEPWLAESPCPELVELLLEGEPVPERAVEEAAPARGGVEEA